jgi:hypothetical protein
MEIMMETETLAILGIDPGSSSGALCFYVNDKLEPSNMPTSMLDILKYLRIGADMYKVIAVMENVGGSRPGNAAKAARTFAEHVGGLKMALLATGIPTYKVTPRKWMVAVCGSGVPTGSQREQVKARKDYIYADLQTKYPNVKFTKRQADAVGLMHYGRLMQQRGELV